MRRISSEKSRPNLKVNDDKPRVCSNLSINSIDLAAKKLKKERLSSDPSISAPSTPGTSQITNSAQENNTRKNDNNNNNKLYYSNSSQQQT